MSEPGREDSCLRPGVWPGQDRAGEGAGKKERSKWGDRVSLGLVARTGEEGLFQDLAEWHLGINSGS